MATHTTVLEGGMAEAVIGGALVAVLEDVVGLVDFLKPMLALFVARITVRMMLHRKFAECCLELDLGGSSGNTEDFVVIALRHSGAAPDPLRRKSRT
jgi:hypothetical protein